MDRTDVIDRLTATCLSLPEAATEDHHPPHRAFVVGTKNFAWYTENEHGDGRTGLCVRSEPGQNEELVASDPERFALPKYVARHGWVTYYLDLSQNPIDRLEVEELVVDSYRIQAPTRLVRLLDA